MAWIDTPWGAIRVPDDVPTDIVCARCGTCCRAFFLSVSDQTLRAWRRLLAAGKTASLPPDLSAVLQLFQPLAAPPPTAEGSWYTCRAFDDNRKLCTLLETDPSGRPQACYAFPYLYDAASLHEVPYPNCHIVREAIRLLGGRLGAHLIEWVRDRKPES